MMNGLKKFGLGILWALLSPILIVGIALVAVFGVFNFLVQFVIMIVNFFRGKKLFPMFPEDEEAYKRIKKALGEQVGEVPAPQQQAQPTQVYVQQNYYTNPAQPGIPPQPMQMPPQNPYQGLPPQNPYGLPPQQNPYGLPPQQNPYAPLPEQQTPPLAQVPAYNKPEKIDIFVDDEEADDL